MTTRAWCLVLCGALLGGPSPARADFINFAGLPGVEAPIPSGYAGFTWNNFSTLNTHTDVNVMPSGYANANTDSASPNVAFNLFGQPASMSSATPFSFYGAFFTAAWRDNLLIDVKGYRNGVQLYEQSFHVSSTGPTFEAFNFQGIDKLSFASSGGTVHGYVPLKPLSHPPLTQFAMDDLVFTQGSTGGGVLSGFSTGGGVISGSATPEPSTLVLFGSGLLLAGLPWRRRTQGR